MTIAAAPSGAARIHRVSAPRQASSSSSSSFSERRDDDGRDGGSRVCRARLLACPWPH
eukprot:CAMPEP_0194746836 /NCGR_PEP_ID=MMETSP0323_2-20130528/859_1 /TAXON_ID=2866 ORGANISM="Crypthecodinium cohnii, Strain Seligo" /NCGR_SAMPLE_ID=MMETSP0323_2 /ASSEMBLY_ACC=CAM_ASM_000346 /LENGTH=57 /DNA_ID=CAMNT_0039659651 /DNA_START=39 /DNA_END=212 /DNA_ORIENTATION=+